MEAVGLLAGGVAHDFNNVLGVITGYGDLLQVDLPAGDPLHNYAAEISKAGRRAAALTRQLLACSRKQIIQPVVLDLNAATGELEKMLGRLIGNSIDVTFERSFGLGRVKFDLGQIEQISDESGSQWPGRHAPGWQAVHRDRQCRTRRNLCPPEPQRSPGSYVMLSVSDTGCGMDKETQLRIFEPFHDQAVQPRNRTGIVHGLWNRETKYGIHYGLE
jgi:two-component system, cell cycle sensor histidine kinase and response regulator CckA